MWLTQGGGLKPGETHQEAAVRELWEETGLTGVELGPWKWRRQVVWRWGARTCEAQERCFLLRVSRFSISPAVRVDLEAETMLEHRWWNTPELQAAAGASFPPSRIGEHLAVILEGCLPNASIDVGF